LATKRFQELNTELVNNSAEQKCLLILVQAIDDKEIGSPG